MKLNHPRLILRILGVYVFIQIMWWAYTILELYELNLPREEIQKKRWMVIGEGSVFLTLLFWGFYLLNGSFKREIELTKLQRNFLLSITHEIQTPLTAIRLTLQTLKKRKLDEKTQNHLMETALTELGRLDGLIDNVITVRSIDAREWVKNDDEFVLEDLIEKRVKSFQRLFPDVHIQFSPLNKKTRLHTDQRALDVIVTNLIDNAIKYGEKSEISVELKVESSYCEIVVMDNGPGIPAEFKSKVFEKFYRIGDEATRQHKGTGLGLYLVKNFTSLVGGTITLENKMPRGCAFTLKIPRTVLV